MIEIRLLNNAIGLAINFNVDVLKHGIKRVIDGKLKHLRALRVFPLHLCGKRFSKHKGTKGRHEVHKEKSI